MSPTTCTQMWLSRRHLNLQGILIKYFPKIIEHIYLKNYCSYTQSQCSPNSNHSSMDWLQHADNMFILYDSVNDFHPQHLGYQPGEEIKQADAILLGYPLQLKMN